MAFRARKNLPTASGQPPFLVLLASVAPRLGPMNMEQATQFYLEEVLGIQNLIRPILAGSLPQNQGAPEAESEVVSQDQGQWEVVGSSPTHILWLLAVPGAEDKQLISKMMAAAKLNSYVIFWGEDLRAIDFSLMTSVSAALLFFGDQSPQLNLNSELHLLKTATLSSMMEGSEASIQIHKKAAWEKIKELMAFLAGQRG